ncbi:poly-gamma-glutamate synthase PgsB [Myxococcota bacterium]|nr:poly-gamma-glutamate synthase PgsB [Myxococcota bacterium]
MLSFPVLASLAALLVVLGALESARHRCALKRLKFRVHVNGTRGKSSVVRLIAAGLRAGGLRTCAKTTGTLARVILPDARELPVFRPRRANIIEQIRIVRAAVEAEAEALVIECMALQPELQWLSEDRFVKATHAVITNARPDHLDVMGPTEDDVPWALSGMIPPKGKLYTAERRHLKVFQEAAADRGAEVLPVTLEDIEAVTEEEMGGFPYLEHRDNVALALRICAELGVDRRKALEGMWAASPDPGAMTEHVVEFFGRRIYFVNGFAANDPESTEYIWQLNLDRHPEVKRRVALFNCRADRVDRSRQLGTACVSWTQPDHIVLMGEDTYTFSRAAIAAGMPPERMIHAEGRTIEQLFEIFIGLVGPSGLVMGMGNIGGQGLAMTRYFKNREILRD